jgi:single-stranded-DNA-specific exonuclease
MPSELPKRWILKEADEGIVERQSEQAKISPLLARLLVLRGLADLDSAKRYLSSSLRSDLPSPFTMTDMEPAVERIVMQSSNGNSSEFGETTMSMARPGRRCWFLLKKIGAERFAFPIDREGYGLNIEGWTSQRAERAWSTVDCGLNGGESMQREALGSTS